MLHSLTSSEGSRLVRIVVPCAQTRLPGHRSHSQVKREARFVLCHSIIGSFTPNGLPLGLQ